MPAGTPSAEALMDQLTVKFFSMDTQVIEAAGFKFSEGALNTLRSQRPKWVRLLLTEVVEKEVLAHRMDPVSSAVQALSSAIANAERLTKISLAKASTQVNALEVLETTRKRFEDELTKYLKSMSGAVIPIAGPRLAQLIFERYFNLEAPFEKRKDKKSEFPDAAALLVLEEYAKKQKCYGVVVSNDMGWVQYAESSERIFCVRSLEEFTSLFQSVGREADAVLAKVNDALDDSSSSIRSAIETRLIEHLSEVDWSIGEISADGVDRADGYVSNATFKSYSIAEGDPKLWFNSKDHSFCVIELQAAVVVGLQIGVEFFKRDAFDRDEFSLGSDVTRMTHEIEVNVFLECKGELVPAPVDDWELNVECAYEEYEVDVGHIDYDPSDY